MAMTDPPLPIPAHGFHPGSPGQTLRGAVRIEGERLRFEHGGGAVELPLAGLQLRRGGHNDSQLFLTHHAVPDWSIYTSDRSLLDHPGFRQNADLEAQAARARKSRPVWVAPVIVLGACLGLAGLLLGILISQKDRLAKALAGRVPIEWETQIGNSIYEQVRREGKLVSDPVSSNRLGAVTARLVPAAAASGYTFRFHVIQDGTINAFAVPGGHLFVHTGLLKAAERPEEVAGVLAHEIAHVTRRHGTRKVIESAGLALTLQLLLGDTSGLTAVLAEGSQLLLRQKYSRDFEREADDAGWDYLVAARIDPRGMIDFFKKLEADQARRAGDRVEQTFQWLNTHPATRERMERLEEKWRRLEPKTGFLPLSGGTGN